MASHLLDQAANQLFKVQNYVLLPPSYNRKRSASSSFRYYVSDPYVKTDTSALVSCRILENGKPSKSSSVKIPVSVIQQRKVKKSEALTDVATYLYQYVLVRVSDNNSHIYKYGQVTQYSYAVPLLWEDPNAHVVLTVKLKETSDGSGTPSNNIIEEPEQVLSVKPADVKICSKLAYFCSLLQNTPSGYVDFYQAEAIHCEIDSSVLKCKSPLLFEAALRNLKIGGSAEFSLETNWTTEFALIVPTKAGITLEKTCLRKVVNSTRSSKIAYYTLPWVLLSDEESTATKDSSRPQLSIVKKGQNAASIISQKYFETVACICSYAAVGKSSNNDRDDNKMVTTTAVMKSSSSSTKSSSWLKPFPNGIFSY